MAQVKVKIHRAAQHKFDQWKASLPGAEDDKDALLSVYFAGFAKKAVTLHASNQGRGVVCPGPANSLFLIAFSKFTRREIEIMILDVR